jgi:hypothetical protein
VQPSSSRVAMTSCTSVDGALSAILPCTYTVVHFPLRQVLAPETDESSIDGSSVQRGRAGARRCSGTRGARGGVVAQAGVQEVPPGSSAHNLLKTGDIPLALTSTISSPATLYPDVVNSSSKLSTRQIAEEFS